MKIQFHMVIFGFLLLAGCGRINHQADFPENKPIALGPNLGDRQWALVKTFSEKERQVFFFFHWFKLNDAGGIKAAEKHLNEGDGVANLRISTYFGPVDYIITILTAGLFTTYTIDTRGDIIKVPAVPPRM